MGERSRACAEGTSFAPQGRLSSSPLSFAHDLASVFVHWALGLGGLAGALGALPAGSSKGHVRSASGELRAIERVRASKREGKRARVRLNAHVPVPAPWQLAILPGVYPSQAALLA